MARRIYKIFKALEVGRSDIQCNINETPVNKSDHKNQLATDFDPTVKHYDSYNSDLSRAIKEAEIIFLKDGDIVNDVIGNASPIETQIAMTRNSQFIDEQMNEIVVAESNHFELKSFEEQTVQVLEKGKSEETMASINFNMEVDQLFDEMPSCSSVQSSEIKVTFDIHKAPIEENIHTEFDINDPDFNPTLEEYDSSSDSESDTTAVIKLPDNTLEDENLR